MQSKIVQFIPYIYICSKHPLAYKLIEQVLTTENYIVESYPPSPAQYSDAREPMLIIDTHSVDEWFETLIQYGFKNRGRVLVLSDSLSSEEEEIRLLYLGVRGVVLMAHLERDLAAAVGSIAAGRLWFRRSVLDEYASRMAGLRHFPGFIFTLREEQVMTFVLNDYSNKEIGHVLGISERTVKFHVSNILQKVDVKSRKGLLRMKKQNQEIVLPRLLQNVVGM